MGIEAGVVVDAPDMKYIIYRCGQQSGRRFPPPALKAFAKPQVVL
jgi:hypothetical protein